MRYFIIFFIFFVFMIKTNADFSYPIREISKVECRFNNFSLLWDDCKMNLPILKTQDYNKYKNDYSLYRRVYTVLWWSSYTYGWDVWNGGHSWLDIATSKWTPVYPITSWKVVVAWFLAWWWNTIKIEHTLNGKKIYSNYAHLSKINVWVWDNVSIQNIIWEVWNTWNSYWNHLHFQIDLSNSSWPWYRKNCQIKDYNSIVNWWACFEELNQNTTDPIYFLETQWANIKLSNSNFEKISKEWLISREEILRREIQEFFKNYNISIGLTNFWWNTLINQNSNFRIKIIDKKTKKLFNGNLPDSLNFKYNSKELEIFPSWILAIENWYRDFTVNSKKPWKITIWVYVWEIFFKNISFGVFDNKSSILPTSWSFYGNTKIVSWDIWKWIIVFSDKNKLNILWVKFDWKYSITSKDKDMFFCVKTVKNMSELSYNFNTNCELKDFKKETIFDYNNSINWLLILNYIKSWNNISTIQVLNNKKDIILSKNTSSILPKWIDKNHIYYNEIIQVLEKWIISWLKDNYILQDRELNEYDAKNMMLKYLYFIKNTTWNLKIDEKINSLLSYNADKYKILTRIEFINFISSYYDFPLYTGESISYRDIKNEIYKQKISNIFNWNTYKDSFWNNYFQSDKKITKWEWMYIFYLNIMRK